MGNTDIKLLARRLTDVKALLVSRYPFFGRLVIHLRLGFASCGTAYTDMQRIVFDPDFASALSDSELLTVYLHEVLHCVLRHCTRGRMLQHFLYNVACDIVVNSTILSITGESELKVAGESLMHIAPDGTEGREHSAEEVYYMLVKNTSKQPSFNIKGIDTHDAWSGIDGSIMNDLWDKRIREASRFAGEGTGIPDNLRRYLHEIDRLPRTNWRQLLHDYIRHDRSDYTYSVPDRRYGGDVIMPSFQNELYGERADKLWFFVDTSGSVTDTAVSDAFFEIKQAVTQIENLSGKISFFDCTVSEPYPFESVEDVDGILPVGGGGTSFIAVFDYLKTLEEDELPCVMIMITDGYAEFPDEQAALGIPVIWIIVDSDVEPPFGGVVRMTTE